MGYTILTQIGSGDDRQEAGEYPLAKTNRNAIYRFQKLRVASAYYDPKTRYDIASQEGFKEQIAKEVKEEGMVSFVMEAPELSVGGFVEESAKVLFPTAPIAGNEQWIDQAVWEEAKEDFLSKWEPREQHSDGSSDALTSSLSRLQAEIEKMGQQTTTGTKKPDTGGEEAS